MTPDGGGWRTGPDGVRVAAAGRIERQLVSAGSRSEHAAPVLACDDGGLYRLHLVGENPFEQPTLRALEGRRVAVSGVWRNGVVRVSPGELQSLEEP